MSIVIEDPSKIPSNLLQQLNARFDQDFSQYPVLRIDEKFLTEDLVLALYEASTNPDHGIIMPRGFTPPKHAPGCGCNACLQKQAARLAEEAADARIVYWIKQGMENTPQNADILIACVDSHPQLKGLPLTPQLVDAAVSLCRDKLTWRKSEPAAPAPPPAPVEELGVLPDGSKQKSINDSPDISWTAAQARDWSKRTNQQQKLRGLHYGGANHVRTSWFTANSQVR